MTADEIATLMNDTAGQRWGDEAHFQRFAAALEKRHSAVSMPAIKLAMEAERENGARAEREACARIAETTICDTHLPTGVQIYGSKAAAAIRARSNA